jgi:type IV secretion system protein VirD4
MDEPGSRDGLAVAQAWGQAASYGLYLGEGPRGPCFARPEHSLLVLGPPRSGKTSGVLVPNLLAANGPVLCASTKPDALGATARARARLGPCGLFDPSGEVPVPPGCERVGWSPLHGAENLDEALLLADAMVRAARPGADRGEALHWSERAGTLLGTLLHAGALEHRCFEDVLSEVDRRDLSAARYALASHGSERALDVLEGIGATEARELSGIWSTTSSVLAGFRSSAALAATAARPLDAAALLASRGTLYVCAGSERQQAAAALVAGIVRSLRNAAYAAARHQGATGPARSPAPLLLALDELAQIAPLHDLPSLVAEGASQGVLTLAALQDLSQARARWGTAADSFLTLFGTKLVLPGIADRATLEVLSLLAGERDRAVTSVTRSPWWAARSGPARSVSLRRERRLPPSAVASGLSGHVLVLDGTRPAWVRAPRWFESPLWAAAAHASGAPAREARLSGPDRGVRVPGLRDRTISPALGRPEGRLLGPR